MHLDPGEVGMKPPPCARYSPNSFTSGSREFVVPAIPVVEEDCPTQIGQAVADLVRELDGA